MGMVEGFSVESAFVVRLCPPQGFNSWCQKVMKDGDGLERVKLKQTFYFYFCMFMSLSITTAAIFDDHDPKFYYN